MAEIKYYSIPGITNGVFTVVCDTELYNTITNANQARDLFPWDLVKLTCVLPVGCSYKQAVYNQLIDIGVDVSSIINTQIGTVDYDLAEGKKVRTLATDRGNILSYFVNNGTQSSTTNSAIPLCCWTGPLYSEASSYRFYVLLANDDMTLCKVVYHRNYDGSRLFDVDNIGSFNIVSYFDNIKPSPQPKPNPYAPGGASGGGGGTGRFSRTGDTIGEHNVPTLSAVDAGFITLFAPTAGEMKALASYLWSDLFSIDTFKKIFANPMDAILGLSIVPVSVPTSGSASVKVGNISTGVSMTKASTQYVKLSCGSLEVEEYWGAYLDYSPYTKCEIYLPYIGIHELSIDDVMGKTVKVVYYIDILSGACTAEIYSNSTCLYSFVGQCSASIPITGNDWTNVINGVMQIGASIGSMVASGGLTAPISAGGVASGLKSVAAASSTVTASKPSVERSGSMSGAGGMLGQQMPYLIITWPKECIPADQNKYIGYPSFVTVNLGEIVGFNIIENVHLENIPATSAELDEIESLLMNGVIF